MSCDGRVGRRRGGEGQGGAFHGETTRRTSLCECRGTFGQPCAPRDSQVPDTRQLLRRSTSEGPSTRYVTPHHKRYLRVHRGAPNEDSSLRRGRMHDTAPNQHHARSPHASLRCGREPSLVSSSASAAQVPWPPGSCAPRLQPALDHGRLRASRWRMPATKSLRDVATHGCAVRQAWSAPLDRSRGSRGGVRRQTLTLHVGPDGESPSWPRHTRAT